MKRAVLLLLATLTAMSSAASPVFATSPKGDPPAAFDLRYVDGVNYVTSIKSQTGGTCWTHGTMAAIESNLLVTGAWAAAGESDEPNLAEYHLDWWNGFNQHYNADLDPPDGAGLEVHQGGDYLVASAYLSRGEGAVRDIDGQSYENPPVHFNDAFHVYYVRDIEWYTVAADLSNIDMVKHRIMSGGAIGTCMGAFYYSSANNSYYQPPEDSISPSHAIAIIGWDDNKVTQAPLPGAWLCKNSWGDNYYGGCFWISYYDKSCGHDPEMGAVAFRNVEPMPYDKVYYHDYHGWRDTKTDCSEAFNRFVANDDHEIQSVSFFTAADSVEYTVRIYDRFESGQLLDELSSISGFIEFTGMHTIDLDPTVQIADGDDFYVYVGLSAGGHPYDRTSVVPVLLGKKYRTLVESSASPGESYYRSGGQWHDLHDDDSTANFCIKALAVEGMRLNIGYPNCRPTFIAPETPVTIAVQIAEINDTYLPGTGFVYYRNHDSMYVPAPLVWIGDDMYEATIPGAGHGDVIKYYVEAKSAGSGMHHDPPAVPDTYYRIRVGTVASTFADDFELDTGWWIYNNALLTDGAWERGVPVGGGDRGDPPTDYSGYGKCYLTGNRDGDSDVDDGATYLYSPIFDVSDGDALIRYVRWYSNHTGSNPHEDVFTVQISTDGGNHWHVVETVGPYTNTSGGWIQSQFRLSDIVEPNDEFMLRFCASDMDDNSIVEAGIDDFVMTIYDCNPSPLTLITTSLPDWTAGHPYNQYLQAIGGVGTHQWFENGSALDGTGLVLSQYGMVSGIPTAAGEISFTGFLYDEGGHSIEMPYTFTINEAVTISTLAVSDWTVNIPMSTTVTATGGTGELALTDKNGDLIGTGLTLATDGTLSGTPIVTGEISFTAAATDEIGAFDEHVYTFKLNAPIEITTVSLPHAQIGVPYSYQLLRDGGTGTPVWTDRDNDLAGTGLTLSSTGMLSGTATIDTTIALTATATDVCGCVDEQPLTLLILSNYVCGDCNNDGQPNVGDAVFIINYVFKGGAEPVPLCAGDANGDGACNVGDAVYMIAYVFNGGPAPMETCCD